MGLSGQLLSCCFPNCIIHYHPYIVWPGIAQTAEQVEKNQPDITGPTFGFKDVCKVPFDQVSQHMP